MGVPGSTVFSSPVVLKITLDGVPISEIAVASSPHGDVESDILHSLTVYTLENALVKFYVEI